MKLEVLEVNGLFYITFKKKFLGLITYTAFVKDVDKKGLAFDSKRKAQAYINFSKNPKLQK